MMLIIDQAWRRKVTKKIFTRRTDRECLTAFLELSKKLGHCPSQEEWGRAMGFSAPHANQRMKRLVNKGLLAREKDSVRKTKITTRGTYFLRTKHNNATGYPYEVLEF